MARRKLQSSEKRWAPAEPELLRKGNVIRYQLDRGPFREEVHP